MGDLRLNWFWIPKPEELVEEFETVEWNHTDVNVCDIVDIGETPIRENEDQEVIDHIARTFQWIREYWKHVSAHPMTDSRIWLRSFIPTIDIVPAPNNPGKYWIVDGVHRYKGAVKAGFKIIPVCLSYYNVKTIDDLRLLQASNHNNPRCRRTKETILRQVQTVLRMRTHWTDVQICDYCDVFEEYVAEVRRDMEEAGEIEHNPNALDGQPDRQMNLM